MSTSEYSALQELRRLDDELHPWSAPGVFPTESGCYWLDDGVEDGPWAVSVGDGRLFNEEQGRPSWNSSLVANLQDVGKTWKFAKRWERAVPR